MKKIIIAIAIILTSGITAYSLSTKEVKTAAVTKTEASSFVAKAGHGQKADLATAD